MVTAEKVILRYKKQMPFFFCVLQQTASSFMPDPRIHESHTAPTTIVIRHALQNKILLNLRFKHAGVPVGKWAAAVQAQSGGGCITQGQPLAPTITISHWSITVLFKTQVNLICKTRLLGNTYVVWRIFFFPAILNMPFSLLSFFKKRLEGNACTIWTVK